MYVFLVIFVTIYNFRSLAARDLKLVHDQLRLLTIVSGFHSRRGHVKSHSTSRVESVVGCWQLVVEFRISYRLLGVFTHYGVIGS
jgi:hypothetical protein